MKKKLLVLTICFTLVFSSLNYKKSYADVGVVSLPMLGVISSLAVGTGIIINNNDDLYDLGRLFYDYIDKHNDLTWSTVQTVFNSCVALQPNKLVSVDSNFLDIVKGFFDETFEHNYSAVGSFGGLPYYGNFNYSIPSSLVGEYYKLSDIVASREPFSIGDFNFTFSKVSTSNYEYKISSNLPVSTSTLYISKNFDLNNTYFYIADFPSSASYPYAFCISTVYNGYYGKALFYVGGSPISIPYGGGYTWDNVENKKENDSISLPVPGNLGQLVGQGSLDFWDNTDNLVGQGGLTLPGVDSPSIGVDGSVNTFPSIDLDVPGVGNPSVPNEGIWLTIKDFIIGLVVPSDTFWTDTWGGLYNNFTNSFPMVDMDGFNDLVTGEKKFPNIDINIMGVTGRVVNGDVINSIVDWLRPIIAGFMMLCLMLFNYRKIYKLIRNSEPFGGIAPGTSDFSTGISEYSKQEVVKATDMVAEYRSWKERGGK